MHGTYALLASGEKAAEPRSPRRLNICGGWIRSVYVIGLRSQIWSYLPQENLTRQLATLKRSACCAAKASGDARFMWHYPGTAPELYDHSVSQYGVLGLWACGTERRGDFHGDLGVAGSRWQAHQNEDGSWQYNFKKVFNFDRATPSMTAAGLATLFIIQEYLYTAEAIKCRGNLNDTAINKGIEWLAKNYTDVYARNPIAGGVNALHALWHRAHGELPVDTNSSATTTGLKAAWIISFHGRPRMDRGVAPRIWWDRTPTIWSRQD